MSVASRYIVYGLIDPRTHMVRYVGKSSSGMNRVNAHRAIAEGDRTYRANWLRSLRAEGAQHAVCVLEATTSEALIDAEVWWIAYGRACGWPLTNLTDGGDGIPGLVRTEETRAIIGRRKEEFYRDNDVARAAVGERTKAWQRDNPEATRALHEAHAVKLRQRYQDNPGAREQVAAKLIEFHRANPDVREACNDKLRTYTRSSEGRASISKHMKERHRRDPGAAAEATRAHRADPTAVAARVAKVKQGWANNPEARARQSAKALDAVTPESRAAASSRLKAFWSNPEKVAARAAKQKATWAAKRTTKALALARLGEEE